MAKAATRQWLVTIEGIDGTWAQFSGGETTAEGTRVRDGGSTKAEVLAAPPETDDITCNRPFDPDRDQDLLTSLLPLVGQFYTTVTKTPLYGDMSRASAKPRVYSNALLTGISEPEADADSGDPARLELTFMVGDIS